jgi:hypothetical protein
VGGGALTQAINWRWIFLVNVPIGIITGLAPRFVEDRPAVNANAGADVPGAVLLTGGLMLGVYAIFQVGHSGWGPARTLGLGTVSVALLGAGVRQASPVR